MTRRRRLLRPRPHADGGVERLPLRPRDVQGGPHVAAPDRARRDRPDPLPAARRERRGRQRAAGARAGRDQGPPRRRPEAHDARRAGRHPAARLSADARRRARAPGRRPALLHRHRGVSAGGGDPGARRSSWTARWERAGRSRTASTRAASTARSHTARARRSALREFAAERDIDLAQSWAYSDAASDLPMLEAVGHPVAVNPDAGPGRGRAPRGVGGAALREARRAAARGGRGGGRGGGRRQRELARGAPQARAERGRLRRRPR